MYLSSFGLSGWVHRRRFGTTDLKDHSVQQPSMMCSQNSIQALQCMEIYRRKKIHAVLTTSTKWSSQVSVAVLLLHSSILLISNAVIYQEDIRFTTLVQSSKENSVQDSSSSSSSGNLTVKVPLIFCILRSSIFPIKQEDLRIHRSCCSAQRRGCS